MTNFLLFSTSNKLHAFENIIGLSMRVGIDIGFSKLFVLPNGYEKPNSD